MFKFKTLATLIILAAFSAPAFAFQVDIHGDFKNRFVYSNQMDVLGTFKSEPGELYVNVTDADLLNVPPAGVSQLDTRKKGGDADFFGEAKYRLWFKATDDEQKVKGVIAFEFGGAKYGSTQMDFGGDDRNFLEVRWLYTDFEVPFDTSSRLSLGLQPVGYNAYFWNDNAAGVKYRSEHDNFSYSLGWWRNEADSVTSNDKDDVYVIDAGLKLGEGNRVYAFAAYGDFEEQTANDSSWNVAFGEENGIDDEVYWFGLAGEGQVDNLFFGATAIYQTGELEDIDGSLNWAGGNKLDRSAYLLNAEVSIALDRFSVKGGWLYASGDDNPDDDEVENYYSLQAYLENISSMVLSGYFGDDNYMIGSNYFVDRGFNVPYINLNHDCSDKLSVGVNYFYWNTAEDIAGDSDLGHELNAIANYAITKGLSAGLSVGYLIGGDAWDRLATGGDGDDLLRTEANIRFRF